MKKRLTILLVLLYVTTLTLLSACSTANGKTLDEQEHIYDVKDIQTILDDEYDNDMYEGVPVKSLMDKVDDIAYKYRTIIDKSEYALHWREAAEQAISNFIKEEKLL